MGRWLVGNVLVAFVVWGVCAATGDATSFLQTLGICVALDVVFLVARWLFRNLP